MDTKSAAAAGLALAFALVLSPATTAAAPEPFQQGLLWRLDKPGVPSSWVYGTLHSSDRRVTALPASVASALARSRTFAMEIYLSDVEEAGFLEATMYEDGRRLAPLLGEEAYARLHEALGPGAPSEQVLERTKPWAALLRVAATTARGDPNDAPMLDRLLLVMARQTHMSILALEDLDEQIAAFDAIPLPTQIALLRHALAHLPELGDQAEPTIHAWLSRDLAALAAINAGTAGTDPELKRHRAELTHALVDNRSVLMAHRLFLPLGHGSVFVAVGALHLYGSKGLLALLRAQGYAVHRVY